MEDEECCELCKEKFDLINELKNKIKELESDNEELRHILRSNDAY